MDLTSPKTIKALTAEFGFTFSKGLGQNFLTDPGVLDQIVEAAEPAEGVLEIGPGFGVLTCALAQAAEKVVSVEIDQRLIPVLQYTLGEFQNVKIIQDDVLKMDLQALLNTEFPGKKISIAANLPYYITTPIVTSLIEAKLPLKNIVVRVQKEVAQRFCAAPGTKDYGAITLLCQYYTAPSIITEVPAARFYPAPKVDSAVVRFAMLDKPRISVRDEKLFFRVVKAAFAQRRKTLLNCLASGFGADKAELTRLLEEAGIDPGVRGERLSIDEFGRIADKIGNIF
jgi:16S rRNA (adenine1518-N6/adenine1519-N6)-dimethyltransferase